jgi:hypothetical protein
MAKPDSIPVSRRPVRMRCSRLCHLASIAQHTVSIRMSGHGCHMLQPMPSSTLAASMSNRTRRLPSASGLKPNALEYANLRYFAAA